jgi:Glycosyl hydrolase catalytic core
MIFGLNTGWSMDAHGNINFSGSVLNTVHQIKSTGAGWVRIEMGGGWNKYADWITQAADNTTRLSQMDQVVSAAKSAGLKILGLIDNATATSSNQAQWSANSVEAGGGNGDNPFIDLMGQDFSMLSQHYAGQIDAWEIWNEPNAWTTSYGVGGTFIYPSNFAWLLKRIKDNQHDKAPLISGGIFAFQDANGLHSGNDYLMATVSFGQGIWGGSLPFDYVGQHLYMPITVYQQAIDQMGAVTGLPVWITEWGWQTPPASYTQQATWLGAANNLLFRSGVAAAFWFKLQDDSTMHYGLYDINNVPKPACTTYPEGAFMDTAIHLRWNSYFLQLQRLFPTANVQLARTDTGIYHAWSNAMLNGKQLGPATSYEYPITDWSGNPGVAQDFGSCRVEWYSSTNNHAYGPYGQIW